MEVHKMKNKYQEFLQKKVQLNDQDGFKPIWIPDFLFDFQQYLVDWSIWKGRGAIFADCGMGKTPMQLTWCENVRRHTNKPVLLITPLAVSSQTVLEAEKFGIDAKVSRDGKPHSGITITNYERLHLFDQNDFEGICCDESSAIKSFDGKHKALVTEFMRLKRYRLLCTATAAPNDFIELGTSSEALGELGYTDMLNRFFKNDQNNTGTGRVYGKGRSWRFKGHAELPFWRWLASWARAIRKPSDYGFDDSRFVLPELIENEYLVKARTLAPGFLFEVPAKGLQEEREEQRRTLQERCEKAAELAKTKDHVVIWCNLNPEGDLLEKLTGFTQIKGTTKLEEKETIFTAFSRGQIRGLITKPKIGAWGMNWQHCNHTILFPSHSYEQYYQMVRRFWRFGQKRPVKVDIVTTESGYDIRLNLQRKAQQMDRMFTALVEQMTNAQKIQTSTNYTQQMEAPQWLSTIR
jgi:hypothetical protein